MSDGSVTGCRVLDRGGRDLNFSFNPSLSVSNTHRSDVIFTHSAMKCFSLPPTGSSDSVSWDGRVGFSGMLSFCRSNCFLFVYIAPACSVVSTPVPFVLSTV